MPGRGRGGGGAARDLITQELGILSPIKRGVRVLTASGDDLTESDDPTRKLMRQVAGAFAEYERARASHPNRRAVRSQIVAP
jgi:hypothetical protein